ncbi:MAG TPA: site-specific integrase [Bryobacteraceae bacterium]|nr:site-specific integrase [Bryobacteraceae bacterium]
MRRNRYQKGSIKKRCGKWIGQYWENGTRRNRLLGPVSTMRKSEAQAKLDKILAPINSAQDALSGDQRFKDFVEGPYFGFYLRKWKKSTAGNNVNRIKVHLFPALADRRLSEVSRDDLQAILDEKATADLSFSVVDHLKWDLKQIFEMAVAEGCIQRNPGALLFTPKEAKRPVHTSMTIEEVIKCLAVLEPRERLIVRLALMAGMRPGEIFALKWEHIQAGSIQIRQRVYRGDIDSPKTSNSVRDAAISDTLAADIELWRAVSGAVRPEMWLFPSEKLDKPIRKDCCWRRNIAPRLKAVGLGWVTFQVMRRTHSSLMNDLKVDPKIVADQLGHTLDVNQNVYTRSAVGRRKEAIEKLETSLLM